MGAIRSLFSLAWTIIEMKIIQPGPQKKNWLYRETFSGPPCSILKKVYSAKVSYFLFVFQDAHRDSEGMVIFGTALNSVSGFGNQLKNVGKIKIATQSVNRTHAMLSRIRDTGYSQKYSSI